MSQVTQKISHQADPQLLSLLETVSNPVQTVTLNVNIPGVFAFPQQWKTTDQANPNMFGYSIQFLELTFEKGKIQPRQLTEKEIKEAEQAKSKKISKKQSKIVEQEKKLSQQEQEAERIKREQWQALSQTERFYRTNQDVFKAPFLKFQKSSDSRVLNGDEVTELKGKLQSGQIQIVLTRKPQISEEEIAKLKKTKPKNLNLAELNKLSFKNKINLSQFLEPGFKQMTVRVKLQQQEPATDAIKFQMKQCYVLVNISIDPEIVPLVKQIKPSIQQLIVLPQKPVARNLDSMISVLKSQIVAALKSINLQYFNFVEQQKQEQISKHTRNKQPNKTVDLHQRKTKFLNDFLQKGKFKTLKVRLEKIISQLCIDKMKKQRTFAKTNKQDIQKKLSELSVFLNQQTNLVISSFVDKHPKEVHEDLLKGQKEFQSKNKISINNVVQELPKDRYLRIAKQYQIVQKLEKSEANYLDLILLDSQNQQNLFSYCQFCLRCKKFEDAQIITEKLINLNRCPKYLSLMAALLLRRKRYKQTLQLLKHLIDIDQSERATYYQLSTFIYKKLGDKKMTVNTRVMAEKMYKLKIGLPVKLQQQEDPYVEVRPKPPRTKPPSLLTPEQTQQFQYQVIQLFARYNQYDLVEQFFAKSKDSSRKELYKVHINVFYQNYSQALRIVENLLKEDDNNLQLIVLKADICYLYEKLFEAEDTYLKAIKLKADCDVLYRVYLRLGHTYLKRMAWQDSKLIFMKACEMKPNSSLSWFALGVSHLRLGQVREAQQGLYLCNIYEPLNGEIRRYLWQLLQLSKAQKNGYCSVGNQQVDDVVLNKELVW